MKIRYFFLTAALFLLVVGLTLGQTGSTSDDALFTLTDTGRIDDANPFTEYTITVTQEGSTIVADLRGVDDDPRFDTLLHLVDENGFIVATNDDRIPRQDLTSRLVYPQAPAGDYRVIATRFGVVDGRVEGDYIIDIEILPPSEITLGFDVSDAALAESGFPQIEPRPRATYTVLAYYGAANNLEGPIIDDVKQFERGGGSDDDVRVVVLLDRHPEYSTADGDWSGARLYEITEANPEDDLAEQTQLSSEYLADLGEAINSGDGELFAQFLVWGIENFPADNYILAIGSHGLAWQGVVTDETGETTIITLPEIREALSVVRDTTGLERFDLLVNDACYMGSVEYHNVVSEFFNYSLASPEIAINPTHNMTLMTERLRLIAQTGVDTEPDEVLVALGSPILAMSSDLSDQYIDIDLQTVPGSDVAFATSAVTDLRRFDAVTESLRALADYVLEDTVNRGDALWRARDTAYVYSGYRGRDDLVDLGSLMRQLIAALDPVEEAVYISYAQDVIAALDQSVRYGRGGLRAEDNVSTYHNIYFPSRIGDFNALYFEQSLFGEWGVLLRALYNLRTLTPWDAPEASYSFHQSVAPQLKVTNIFPTDTLSVLTGFNVSGELVGRNISSGTAIFDYVQPDGRIQRLSIESLLNADLTEDGRQVRVNRWRQGASPVVISWDMRLFVLTDGENTNFERLIYTADSSYIEGRFRQADSTTWSNVTLTFDPDTGEFNRAVAEDPATGSTAVVEIPDGAIFESFAYRVTSDGRQVAEPGNEYVFNAGLRWESSPAPSGEYRIGFSIETQGGGTTSATVNVTVDNDSVPDNLVPFNQQALGFVLTRPSEWTEIAPIDGTLRSQALDGMNTITIYPAQQGAISADDPLSAALELVLGNEQFALTQTGEARSITISGAPALEFDYTVARNGQPFIGRGFVTYLAGTPFEGLAFGAETRGSADDLDAIYADLLNTFVRYDPSAVAAADTSDWALVAPLGDAIIHPILVNGWAFTPPDEASAWAQWTPETDDIAAFFNFGEFPVNPNRTREELIVAFFESDIVPTFTATHSILDAGLTYRGAYGNWSALIYQTGRDGVSVIGRLYVRVTNQRLYAIWFEAPATPDGQALSEGVFEFIVDGFVIEDVPLEVLGVIPNVVNLGPTFITAADDTEPPLLIRYDARSVVLFNRLPNESIDLSTLELVQLDADGSYLHYVPMTQFGFGDVANVRPGDCYRIWTLDYVEIPTTEFPADICGSAVSFVGTANTFWLNETPGATFIVLENGRLAATCQTVRPINFEDYDPNNPDNPQRQCLVELIGDE